MDRLFDRRAGLPRRPLANLALSPSDAKGDPLEQLCGSCSWPRDSVGGVLALQAQPPAANVPAAKAA